jgi:hypothetical protein
MTIITSSVYHAHKLMFWSVKAHKLCCVNSFVIANILGRGVCLIIIGVLYVD